MVDGNNFVPADEPSWEGEPLADGADDVLLDDDESKQSCCSLSVASKGNNEATATGATTAMWPK